ncbi:hypothetical protein E4U42_003364 [Claviceps africana]|uniref:Uncharacterized protein n=1 Tax=Claviceps africana TaxID=83212 RepID=A0A8K0J708_9HYPO|nr:hypothetical protein E4U42_003364 [Claviceps africana]
MVRIKERYLLVNILYPPDTNSSATNLSHLVSQHRPTVDKLTPQALAKGIKAEIGLLFGDCGLGAFEGTLSAHYQMLWSALTCMDRIPVKDGHACIFRVVRVSGTIRKVEEEAIRQARQLILAAKEYESADGAFSSMSLRLRQDKSVLDVVDGKEEGSDLGDAMDEDDR